MVPPTPTQPSLSFGDIIFTLLRHKWKIMFFSLLGLAGGAAIWYMQTPLYESRAQILVRYVAETRSPMDVDGAGDVVRSPESRGNSTVLPSEVAILQSIDGLRTAVELLTPERILGPEGGANPSDAVAVLARNLRIEVPKAASHINISLKHRDPQIAQAALASIINSYRQRHVRAHRPPEAFEDLEAQTETIRVRLNGTEEQLRRAKNDANIIALPEAKAEIAGQLSELQKKIYETEAQLAERRAHLEKYAGLPTGDVVAADDSEAAGATNNPVSSVSLEEYTHLRSKLTRLRDNEAALSLTYKDENRTLQQVRQQIAQTEEALERLGINPEMVSRTPVRIPGSPVLFDPNAANAEIASLQARYATLTNQYAKVHERAMGLDAFENRILQLQRSRDLDESQYTFFKKSLEQARVNQAIDATRLSNIFVAQQPTVGAPADESKKMKLAAAAVGLGIAFGIGLAFLIDFVLDTSVKRRHDLEAGLKVPVLAAIPSFGRNGHSKLKRVPVKSNGSTSYAEIPPWDENDPMQPYYEAVRDRIVMSYGEDSHKPKVVGITSCNSGAGVSRIATGLAAAMSRDVRRDVLLIGLEKNKVTVSAFAKGMPSDLRRNGAGEVENGSPVEANLYALAATGRGLSGSSLVQSFCDLMPRLRVADYDYIIFDLPPITQTSGSLRLATQMERTLLVVEAEETGKAKVKRVKSLLGGSKTQLFGVFNKAQKYSFDSSEDTI